MPDHVVEAGECISSIANDYGLFWETIWNDPKNASLKELRKDPNILLPGDVLYVIDKRVKKEKGETGKRHKFRLKGVPALCRLQLFDGDEPRANQKYELLIDGKKRINGITDAKGILEANIPPDAKEAKLTVGPDRAEFALKFGHLNPIDEISGVKARLNNLGFDCGSDEGEIDEQTVEALKAFQTRFGLEATGELDDKTRAQLRDIHDVGSLFPEEKAAAPAAEGAPAEEEEPADEGASWDEAESSDGDETPAEE
ncbi:MAG: peptidoglycan-binding protein, partial [Pyrinomonadaceae bacterium]